MFGASIPVLVLQQEGEEYLLIPMAKVDKLYVNGETNEAVIYHGKDVQKTVLSEIGVTLFPAPEKPEGPGEIIVPKATIQ